MVAGRRKLLQCDQVLLFFRFDRRALFLLIRLFLALAVQKPDQVLVGATDHGGRTDRHQDRKENVHGRRADPEDRPVTKSLKEEIMDQVELQRDRTEERKDRVPETDLHHDKKDKEHKAEDERNLYGQAAELIEVTRILTRDLAPVGVFLEEAFRDPSEDRREDPK